MVSTFGNCAMRRVNARAVMIVGSPSAPRRARMSMRECNVIAGLFTAIRRDIRSNCSEFAKWNPLIAWHCRSIRRPESRCNGTKQTVRRPFGRSHRQSTHER
ncbi:hypothetical protein [Burkholderia anthina]|uniref:Uncharacterized protein n=1 Tax=Burkholderia anthina TaxID=179879 RepID=A0ABS2AY74_9BURK|nr:hypothetical protein [Burkholderia anthina]MBM2765695.1 hypothetical protein [Burkholderia anthina]